MKPSIKTITVKQLINFLLVLALLLLIITGLNFRTLSTTAVENKAIALAEVVRSGLTSHMKAEIMDKRDYYLEEIRQVYRIRQLEIIRGDNIQRQFGSGHSIEKEPDSFSRQVFETREPALLIKEFASAPTVRVVIPYIASREGALNCLVCHEAREGEVLGAVDMVIDVTDYRNITFIVLGGLTLVSLVFLGLIIANTSRTIQRHVKAPLEVLVADARKAYRSNQPVNPEHYDTLEFSSVADEFNLFNSEIVAHRDMLREKNRQLLALNDEIESTLRETVYTMGVIEEQRSKETSFHTKRVSLLSRILARKLGLPEKEVDLLEAASPLHDIGKLGIPDEILFKPSSLTPAEFKVMENHTNLGYAMLRHSRRDILMAASIIAQQHHEHWDGTGYPLGLKGEEIHVFGRIVALVDVFDALYTTRVYKDAWDLDAVVDWISKERGKQFDPKLVDIFLESVDEFVAVFERYKAELPRDSWASVQARDG